MALQENEMVLVYGPNKMDLMFALFDDRFPPREVMFNLDTEPTLHIWATITAIKQGRTRNDWVLEGVNQRMSPYKDGRDDPQLLNSDFSCTYNTSTRKGVYVFKD